MSTTFTATPFTFHTSPSLDPQPANVYNAILIDVCGYQGGICLDSIKETCKDYQSIACGTQTAIAFQWQGRAIRLVEGDPPFLGLFKSQNKRLETQAIQTRIHFIGFIAESSSNEIELLKSTHYIPNPQLLPNSEWEEVLYKPPFIKELS